MRLQAQGVNTLARHPSHKYELISKQTSGV